MKYLSIFILIFGIIFSAALIGNAMAQSEEISGESPVSGIQYPVTELGNCQNEAECKSYCNKPENRTVCLDFAEKNNLMTADEVKAAKKFLTVKKGPGGCTSKESCEKFCDDISNINECVAFAEKNNLMPEKQLEEAKKIRTAIKNGVKPPACGNKKTCDVYCSSADHMEECMAFAEAAGLMSENEKQESKKVLQAIKKGVKMPQCRGKEECDSYCSAPDHLEECMAFAEAAGLMDEKQIEESKKMLQAVKKGIKPPACRGKEECDAYCGQESHFEECIKFAEAAGFMSPKDVEMARKTGGKGPGGCKGKEECEAFCNNPDNQETCFNFGKEHGLMSDDDVKKMDEGKKQFLNMLSQAPPEVTNCLNSSIGSELIEKIKNGSAMPSQKIGEKVHQCFESIMGSPTEARDRNFDGSNQRDMLPVEAMSAELKECLKTTLGKDAVGRLQSGNFKDENESEFQEKAKICFEQFGRQEVQKPNFQNQGRPKEFENTGDQNMPRPIENFGQGAIPSGDRNIIRMNNAGNFPPEIIECLKSSAGENIAEQIKAGTLQPGPEIGEKIQNCFAQLKSNIPQNTDTIPMPATRDGIINNPDNRDGSEKGFCIQVITPAKNLTTGECREFPTPCDVPQGWEKTYSCGSNGGTNQIAPMPAFPINQQQFNQQQMAPGETINNEMPQPPQPAGENTIIEPTNTGTNSPTSSDSGTFSGTIIKLIKRLFNR